MNNKLETHIHDKNNPHDVNAEQLNVYEKEHIDEIDERVNDIAENIDGNADIIQLKTDVNQNTNDISSLGGRVSVNESGISVLNTRVLSNEQSLLLTAKLSEVIGMIQEHNNNEESHQYILRLIATVQAGGVKPLVFDTLAQLENWLNAGTVEHQGFVPVCCNLGQTLYTIPQNEMDYWVSKLPVLELADLTPFSEADLSNYVQQSELLPINAAIAQLGIDVEALKR